MKVEIVRTATLYVTLAASELTLIQANSWQEVPPLSHDLVLYPAPHPGSGHSEHGQRGPLAPRTNPSQVVARIQLRADYVSGFNLRTAGDDALELRVPPGEITDLNRNLVGPVVLLEDIPASELRTVDAGAVVTARSAGPPALSSHPDEARTQPTFRTNWRAGGPGNAD